MNVIINVKEYLAKLNAPILGVKWLSPEIIVKRGIASISGRRNEIAIRISRWIERFSCRIAGHG
jgi:hypothetical protein